MPQFNYWFEGQKTNALITGLWSQTNKLLCTKIFTIHLNVVMHYYEKYMSWDEEELFPL